ncbi:MAG: SRPBCC domain-containing protein [Gammaproteobacteria bacterium]
MNQMKAFTHERRIAASSKAIFKAFQDKAILSEWYGPDGFSTTSHSFEFKPGGKWVFVMHGPDGTDYPNEMIFQEIVAPNKIVMRHSVQPYFTATVTIEDVDGGALVTFHQDFDSEAVAKNMAHIVKPANEQVLDKLLAVVING